MFTAHEARELAKKKNTPEDIVNDILRNIKIEARNGEYEFIYESSHSSVVNTEVYKRLKDLGYQVFTTPTGVFMIRW